MSQCCDEKKPAAPEKPAEPENSGHSCCAHEKAAAAPAKTADSGCCPSQATAKSRPDYLLWGSLLLVAVFYANAAFFENLMLPIPGYHVLAHSVFELINTMWWGVLIGILMLAILSQIPREFVISLLGRKRGLSGIFRATAAGVLLDLCSHGILMVGSKLYERGASAGQVMAFLVASPWNSFSLTLVLIALVGLPWTLAFIVFSMLIAVITGLVFEALCARKVLPDNPNRFEIPENFSFFREAGKGLKQVDYSPALLFSMLGQGIRDSRMVLRWLLFGVLLASLVRAVFPVDAYQEWFGPSMLGLAMTMVAATIIEVCSEGSTPIAADLVNRAAAPGNGFAFLMTGVSTDYTEIMVIRDTTSSWKIALFLPLVTVPQVMLLSWLMNVFSV